MNVYTHRYFFRWIWIMFLFILFSHLINQLKAQQLLIGVKGGILSTSFRVLKDERGIFNNNSGRITPTLGGFFHVSVDDYVGIDLELNYSERGCKTSSSSISKDQTGNSTDIYTTGEYRMVYVDVPVLLSLYVNAESKWRPKFYLGPSLNFMTQTKLERQTTITQKGNQIGFYLNEETLTDRFKTLDLMILVGGGLNYRFSTRSWVTFDIRYIYSLMNVNTEKNYKADIRNRGIGVMIGLAYSLDR